MMFDLAITKNVIPFIFYIQIEMYSTKVDNSVIPWLYNLYISFPTMLSKHTTKKYCVYLGVGYFWTIYGMFYYYLVTPFVFWHYFVKLKKDFSSLQFEACCPNQQSWEPGEVPLTVPFSRHASYCASLICMPLSFANTYILMIHVYKYMSSWITGYTWHGSLVSCDYHHVRHTV